jgi:phosphate transport system ATP-binding protein
MIERPSLGAEEAAPETIVDVALEAKGVNAWYGKKLAIRDVSLEFGRNSITALMGPSGCGKTTFLRCLNRIHESALGARSAGEVLLDGQDVYAPRTNPIVTRRRIGMVFQRPNPFPTMSILDNVTTGPRRIGLLKNPRLLREAAEEALTKAALLGEVKDKLGAPASALSGGQQQRLCIARALAVNPEVLLMDEPTSALDPLSTLKIEELMENLAKDFTVIIVTHNLQQAARVSDYTAFMLGDEDRVGMLVEYGPTQRIFTHPREGRTEDYITGRFG